MENKLLTVMFIDMQGYTRKSATQTIDEMKLFHDEMLNFVKQITETFSGIIVKSLGDGFLMRFDSPTSAVMCGNELQRKLESRNANVLNPDHFVRFRIGINTGEVGIDESGDLFGDPVNIASRIQTFAEPNEVFISESTFLAMGRNQFGVVDLGPQKLKNALREIKIYKVLKKPSAGITISEPGKTKKEDKSEAHDSAPSHGTSTYRKGILVGIAGVIAFLTIVHLITKRINYRKLPTPPGVNQVSNPGFPNSSTFPGISAPPGVPGVPVVHSSTDIKQPSSSSASQSFDPTIFPPMEKMPYPFQTLDPYQINPLQDPSQSALIQNPKIRNLIDTLRLLRNANKLEEAISLLKPFKMNFQPKTPNVTHVFQKHIVRLMMAQLLWENDNKEEANEIFSAVLSEIPDNHQMKINAEKRIELIKSHHSGSISHDPQSSPPAVGKQFGKK
ncbi:MAG: adenylate/guanylate cyclase domain-containing protein [Candidatus Riflebacteria bacterium]|nr:adenylate/guanylate cyclase domain-containing protein [Candidatus Riflebacteria bacterium]